LSFVVDANIAVKWAVPEDGSAEAYAVLKAGGVIAPDLIIAECANILWKKTLRGDMTAEEAEFCAQLIENAEFETVPTRSLLRAATAIAIQLGHPAHDCVYLALARARGLRLATADDRLLRRLGEPNAAAEWSGLAVPLAVAATLSA
jgi:predicted nucleic acid-binding protein